jgi:hypothetical protein
MNFAEIVEGYNAIMAAIMAAIESDPDILGDAKWLRWAIQESDLNISNVYGDGSSVNVWGSTYTVQTMSNEFFDFDINLNDLEF